MIFCEVLHGEGVRMSYKITITVHELIPVDELDLTKDEQVIVRSFNNHIDRLVVKSTHGHMSWDEKLANQNSDLGAMIEAATMDVIRANHRVGFLQELDPKKVIKDYDPKGEITHTISKLLMSDSLRPLSVHHLRAWVARWLEIQNKEVDLLKSERELEKASFKGDMFKTIILAGGEIKTDVIMRERYAVIKSIITEAGHDWKTLEPYKTDRAITIKHLHKACKEKRPSLFNKLVDDESFRINVWQKFRSYRDKQSV